MAKPGRKSKTDIAMAQVTTSERPGPVQGLSDEHKFEWMKIVNASEANRFPPEILPLLESYVRHRVALRRVADLVAQEEASETFSVPVYDKILKMQERESRALASLAVRLGFAKSTGTGAYGKKQDNSANPWE